MAAPQPQTTAKEISDDLWGLALQAGTHDVVRAQARRLLRECDELQKANVVDGSLLKSHLFALQGDAKEVAYWERNAEQNGGRNCTYSASCTNACLLGRISEAYAKFDNAVEHRYGRPVISFLSKALSSGWFFKAAELIAKSNQAEVPEGYKATADQGVQALREIDLTEQVMCRIMDKAHGQMVERGFIWLDALPEISFLAHAGGPHVYMSYRLACSPEVAAEMSWNLAMDLVSLDLEDRGVLVSYQGTVCSPAGATSVSHLVAA